MTSNTQIVNLFNFLNFQNTLSLKDMENNIEYKIAAAYKISGKFGDNVALKINNKILYLPKRFNVLTDACIQHINNGTFSITKIPFGNDDSRYNLELKQLLPFDGYYTPFVN